MGEDSYQIFQLDTVDGSASLPYSLKILLENLLRTEDGANITADDIRALAGWDPSAEPSKEIQFTPARVIMTLEHRPMIKERDHVLVSGNNRSAQFATDDLADHIAHRHEISVPPLRGR